MLHNPPHLSVLNCSDDEFIALLDPPSSQAAACPPPLPLLKSLVDNALTLLNSASAPGCNSDAGRIQTAPPGCAVPTREKAKVLLGRIGEVREGLKQLKLDVAAWVKSAAEVLPGQAEVERGVEEVGGKLNELQMKMRSSAGDGGKNSSSASPDLLDDMTALAALISRAHNVCLLRQAFTSAALPLQQHHILNALKFIRDHHVAAVARILHAPLSFAAARNGMLRSFKFEGLEAALFELPEISGCVQAQVSLHDVLATIFTEQHASQLCDSWFMQGCAMAWSNHWLPFESPSSSSSAAAAAAAAAGAVPSSPPTTATPSSSDLSHFTNTPWAVQYARASIIEVYSWLDSRPPDSSSSSQSSPSSWSAAAAWSMAFDHTVFIRFVCDKILQRIQQHAESLMTGADMQLYVETLDSCCECQKIINDICEPAARCAQPSALAAFCDGDAGDDMFESWMYVDSSAAELSWATVLKCSASESVQPDASCASDRVCTKESDCLLGAAVGMWQRAALIPSPRHKCTYVNSIIIPFLLRYHKSLNARFTAAVDSGAAGHISAVPVRASVTNLMVMLAAAGHVVRALQSWDVLVDCFAADHDADVTAAMQSAEAAFVQLTASIEAALCNLITAPFLDELPDVLKLYSSSTNSGVFSNIPSKAAAAAASAAVATGSKALQFLGLRSQHNEAAKSVAPQQQQQQQQQYPLVAQPVTYGVSALMSRLLDALVDTISLCKPLSDVSSFRTLLLKVACIVDAGYMDLVVTRAAQLNEKGSKQMQTDAQAVLDSFKSLGSSPLPLAAAAVKLLGLDLVSKRSLLRQLMGGTASSGDALAQRGAAALKDHPDAARNMLVTW